MLHLTSGARHSLFFHVTYTRFSVSQYLQIMDFLVLALMYFLKDGGELWKIFLFWNYDYSKLSLKASETSCAYAAWHTWFYS